ncbi:MAG: hypothetical protein U5K37_07690 [Natrialbaceae archaeon]|nr:hypothetical protein [Natrialbaceae archaeon]
MDTAKPDPQLEELLADLEADIGPIADATGLRAIAGAEWLSYVTDYRMLEIDRLAWWLYTDEEERIAALDVV